MQLHEFYNLVTSGFGIIAFIGAIIIITLASGVIAIYALLIAVIAYIIQCIIVYIQHSSSKDKFDDWY